MNSGNTTDPRTLARRIRAVRESRSLSQGEVAVQAGVDQSYISRLENGDIESPGLLQVGAISRALGIDLWVLAGIDDAAFDSELTGITEEAGTEEETLADLAGRDGVQLGNFAETGKNILIVGHAGCGKTRVARAVARRMRGKVTYITTDGDTRSGVAAIDHVEQRLVATGIKAAARSSDGLVVDSLPATWLTDILDSAAGVGQLVCVCSVKKMKEEDASDAEVLQAVARKLHTDGRGLGETFDYLVRCEHLSGDCISVKVLAIDLVPTLTPLVGR